jgi:hypothetical protein
MVFATSWFSLVGVRCYGCRSLRNVKGDALYVPLPWAPCSAWRVADREHADLRCRRCQILLAKVDGREGLTSERHKLRIHAAWASRVEIGCYACAGGMIIELGPGHELKIYDLKRQIDRG